MFGDRRGFMPPQLKTKQKTFKIHYLVGDNFAVAAISVVRICLSFGISLAFPTSMSTITTITMSISMIVGRIVWVMVVARSYRLSTNLFP